MQPMSMQAISNALRHNKTAYSFIIKFCLLYGTLYLLNYTGMGITIPGGYYSPWAAQHLNYVNALRELLLNGALLFVRLFGFSGNIDAYRLHVPGVSTVRIIYSCIGINVLIFWWAFIFSFPQSIKRKAAYFITGTAAIMLLNIMRIGTLAMVHPINKHAHTRIDHHLIFNIIVYGFIFLLLKHMIKAAVDKQKPLQV